MRVALYARVSTESQQARGTIGSQLAVLRERVGVEGDGRGRRVLRRRPLRGPAGPARAGRAARRRARAGLIERVWCLSPDRLARVYAYQVIVLDELARHGVSVRFTDAPPLDDDPQAKLLTQVQGVIAEYERAKIAERYRRGKLFRSRAGEVLAWRTPYGYRRQPRDAHGPARLEVFEPEAAIVRRIFDDYVHGGHSLREIIRRLAADQIPPPTGRDRLWRPSTLSNLLRNEAYIGRRLLQPHRSRPRPAPRPAQQAGPPPPRGLDHHRGARHHRRRDLRGGRAGQPRQQPVESTPGRTRPMAAAWPGQMRGLPGRHELPQDARPQRHLAPLLLLPQPRPDQGRRRPTGAAPNATSAPTPSTRSCSTRSAPRCYAPTCSPPASRPSPCAPPPPTTSCSPPSWPAWTASSTPPTPNAAASSTSTRPASSSYSTCNAAPPRSSTAAATSTERRDALTTQRQELTRDNQLRRRVGDFARRVLAVIDTLDFDQRQTLLRLVVEDVHVTGWHVQIRLRIPLDDSPDGQSRPPGSTPDPDDPGPVSTQDRLRSLGGDDLGVVHKSVDHRGGDDVVAEHLAPAAEGLVAGDDQRGAFVAAGDELEEQVRRFGFEGDVAHLVDLCRYPHRSTYADTATMPRTRMFGRRSRDGGGYRRRSCCGCLGIVSG